MSVGRDARRSALRRDVVEADAGVESEEGGRRIEEEKKKVIPKKIQTLWM